MAQLVEWSLLIPEVRSSNPVIGKIYIEHLFTINCMEKTKINKRGREWPTFLDVCASILKLIHHGANLLLLGKVHQVFCLSDMLDSWKKSDDTQFKYFV